jgi:hypothetical protein
MRARILLVCFMVGAPLRARAHSRHPSDEEQRRKLMSELAAAAAEAPQEQRSDADLMYDALRQWRGEPRGSAAVNKVIAESKEQHQERKAAEAKLKPLFFKDPFAADPNEMIPVRKVDRQLLAAYEARHDIERPAERQDEISRLRGELAHARADAAAAHAEASRLRGELAHSGSDSRSDGECVASASGTTTHARVHGSRPMASNDRVSSDDWADETPVRRHHRAKPRAVPQETAAAPAPAPQQVVETVAATAPSGWHSTDPRGIIVVPIETPVAIRADIRR